MVKRYETTSEQDLGLDAPSVIDGLSNGNLNALKLSLPKVDINTNNQQQDNQQTQEQKPVQQDQPTQPSNNGGGDGLNINLPDVNLSLPDINLPSVDISTPQIDIPSVDLPKIELPQVDLPNVDIPSVDLAPVNDLTNAVINTTINTGDAIVDSTLEAANQFYDTTENFFKPVVDTTVDIANKTADTINQDVIQPTANAVSDIANTVNQDIVQPTINAIGDTINTIGDTIEPIIKPIEETVGAIDNSIGQITQPIGEAAGQLIADTTNTAVDIGKDFINTVGDTAKPAMQIIENASKPVADAINNAVAPIADAIGDSANYILESSSITKGDGSDYGHIAIGDSGYSVDASKIVDDAYSNVTKGTVLEGTSGKDIYDVATDPTKFIQNQEDTAATSLLTNNLGMDSGLASNVVQAIKDPTQFVETQGKQAAVDLISKNTGVDSGLVGAGLDVLSSKDAGEAVQKIAETTVKKAATDTVVHGVSTVANAIVPGAGAVIEFVAAVFHYSCYLSTGAYGCKLIDKKQYLEFTRYRIEIQSKELFAKQVWIGYQLAFEPIMQKMFKDKKYAEKVNKRFIQPWYKYIRNRYHGEKLSFMDYIKAQSIRWISLMTYYAHPVKSLLLAKKLTNIDVMKTYKNNIKFFEFCKQKELNYV